MLRSMEWIQYSTATRRRFGLTTQLALDALALEYDVVDVKRLSEESGLWTVEICGSAYDGFNRSIVAPSVAEAAYRLARWNGVDIKERQSNRAAST